VSSDEGADGTFNLYLWSINGELLSQVESPCRVNCLDITGAMEGVQENVVVGGCEDGILRFWALDDLKLLYEGKYHNSPINAIALSSNHSMVWTVDAKGNVIATTYKS